MNGNLCSALFNFGAAELNKLKNGKKIKVHPNQKRKSGNGSHQAVSKGCSAVLVPLEVPPKKAKYSCNFAFSVAKNKCIKKIRVTFNEMKDEACSQMTLIKLIK